MPITLFRLVSPLLTLLFTGAIYPAAASTDDAPAVDQLMTVEAIVAERQPLIEEVPVSGTINPLRQAMLSAEVPGLVTEVHSDIGQQVQQGDLLLQLDPELNRIGHQAALAEVTRVKELLADSRRRLRELQALVGDRHVAETEVATLASEVRQRDAQLKSAEVEAQRQAALLRRHRITAPFSGTVSQRQVEVGEWVEPGSALFELVATDQLRADFRVPQRYFPRIQADTRIQVQLDDGRTFTANVEHKVPVSRSGGRTFVLRTTFSDPGSSVIPGMSASATLQLQREQSGIALPRDAVLRYPDGRVTVWVTPADSNWGSPAQVTEQRVTTGLSFNGLIEIKSGVRAGQRVVIRGNEGLQQGQSAIIKRAAN